MWSKLLSADVLMEQTQKHKNAFFSYQIHILSILSFLGWYRLFVHTVHKFKRHKFKRHKLVMTSNPFSIPGLIFVLALRNQMLLNIPKSQPIPDDLLETIGIFKMYRKQLKPLIHSRYRKSFYKSLNKSERRLRSRKIPRCALAKFLGALSLCQRKVRWSSY